MELGINGYMKRCFGFFMLLVFLATSLPAQAKQVDFAMAGKVAQQHERRRKRLRRAPEMRLKYSAEKRQSWTPGRSKRRGSKTAAGQISVEKKPAYYVFENAESANGGFIVIAGDDIAKPVLGYSDSGPYDENNMSPEFAYWMETFQEQIEKAEADGVAQTPEIKEKWDALAEGAPLAAAPNTFLVSTKWGQGNPYYLQTPVYDGSRSLTGCVATALSQIMNFHKFPVSNHGSSEPYTASKLGINVPSVDLNVDYDWDYMSNTYPVYDADATRKNNAVAQLMFHVGASVKMNYSPSSSGATSANALAALKAFGYKNAKSVVRSYKIPIIGTVTMTSTADWEALLRNEIDNNRPVYYTGDNDSGGHAFVMDGYRTDGTFHFNWGWGGSYDGWFVSSALQSDYNNNQDLIYDIYPVPTYASGISLNKSSATIAVGGTDQLAASVSPSEATNRKVSWTSNNPSVANVSSAGLITAVAPGSATITAIANDGGFSADCAVSVPWPEYSITYNLNGGGGAANPSSYTEASGTITLAAPSRANSIFKGWYENATFTDAPVTEIPNGSTGNKSFYAKWFCDDGYYNNSATTCAFCPHISIK